MGDIVDILKILEQLNFLFHELVLEILEKLYFLWLEKFSYYKAFLIFLIAQGCSDPYLSEGLPFRSEWVFFCIDERYINLPVHVLSSALLLLLLAAPLLLFSSSDDLQISHLKEKIKMISPLKQVYWQIFLD